MWDNETSGTQLSRKANYTDGCVSDMKQLLCKVNGVLGTQSGQVQSLQLFKMSLIKASIIGSCSTGPLTLPEGNVCV